MSETEKDEPRADDAEFDEPALQLESDTHAGKAAKPGGGVATSIAWLALFLALLSVAALGYLYLEKYRAADAVSDASAVIGEHRRATEEQLETAQNALSDMRDELAQLQAGDTDKDAVLESLQGEIDDLGETAEQLDSIAPRLANLERSIAAMQGFSVDNRNTFLLAEAEYYMQIANAQLQLAANPELASMALTQADDRLAQIGDPALLEVRRAVADEQAALEVMEKPDVAGVALTLASLARVVDSLPIRQSSAEGGPADDSDARDASGMQRAWGAVKGAVSGLVTYTPPSDAEAPLLVPQAEPMLRSNLALQLQAARLALLRGEQALFEQSIDDANQWLADYFDNKAEPVRSARQTLDDIKDDYSKVAAPDISTSLRLLRQYQTLADGQQ